MNGSATKIVITSVRIGDYQVDVPNGLSELLEGAWRREVRSKVETGYSSETRLIDGRFTTYLRKVQKDESNP